MNKTNLFNSSSIEMVVGSWGSYNEMNERGLGSEWLRLADYESWEEIEEELKNEGFELEGMDEELFVQDIQYFNASLNWDYVNPERFFNLLKDSGVLDDSYKEDLMNAVIEALGWEEFKNLVDQHGSDWDQDLYLYSGQSMLDVATEIFDEYYGYEIPEHLRCYIDYEAFARDLSYDPFYEVEGGVLEDRR